MTLKKLRFAGLVPIIWACLLTAHASGAWLVTWRLASDEPHMRIERLVQSIWSLHLLVAIVANSVCVLIAIAVTRLKSEKWRHVLSAVLLAIVWFCACVLHTLWARQLHWGIVDGGNVTNYSNGIRDHPSMFAIHKMLAGWPAIAIFILGVTLVSWRLIWTHWVLFIQLKSEGLCHKCGYSVLSLQVCPECGEKKTEK